MRDNLVIATTPHHSSRRRRHLHRYLQVKSEQQQHLHHQKPPQSPQSELVLPSNHMASSVNAMCCSSSFTNQHLVRSPPTVRPAAVAAKLPPALSHASSAPLSMTMESSSPKPTFPQHAHNAKFQQLIPKATGPSQNTKPNSIVCADCDGNGAVQCSQCKGGGVNLVDHFNGQFKAGGLCWLCRGKREILCGNCNGAGFVGGFLSTQDD